MGFGGILYFRVRGIRISSGYWEGNIVYVGGELSENMFREVKVGENVKK